MSIESGIPNHTYTTCSVVDCAWSFDRTSQPLPKIELAVASHMVEHSPRELFVTINALNSEIETEKRLTERYRLALERELNKECFDAANGVPDSWAEKS